MDYKILLTVFAAVFIVELGDKTYVWKISYENSAENTLAKLVVADTKIAGFWLQ